MAAQNGKSTAPPPGNALYTSDANGRQVEYPVDSQVVAHAAGTRVLFEHPAFPRPKRRRRHWLRWIVVAAFVLAAVGAGLYFLVPMAIRAWNTVSTDDAFVAGHITRVSPRVDGVVTGVFLDQNDRVHPGMTLVQLDREPFVVALARAEAGLKEARANVVEARATVQSQLAAARANFYRRKNAQETIRRQVATLRARVATLKARESSRWLADVDQKRIANLVARGSATQSELDQRNNTLRVADERVREASEAVQETRATLGLPPDTENPLSLPQNLEQTQSTVQSAVSEIAASLAEIGISVDPKDAASRRAFDDFLRPNGDVSSSEALARVLDDAPAMRVARAAVERAEREVEAAKLRLSYTEIRSELSGYVENRAVNPGNRVQPGQTLLSIRPDYVWITANYKETQVHNIRIGMPVDLEVDAYPDKIFQGRVAGFSPGTGLAGALLPPENATGNYVKVTQRLPIRIELTETISEETPLFVGLSVVPRVRYKERPTGPGAGERLHPPSVVSAPDLGAGPAGRLPINHRPNREKRKAP